MARIAAGAVLSELINIAHLQLQVAQSSPTICKRCLYEQRRFYLWPGCMF